MKKTILSSICVLAIFSINANAKNIWEKVDNAKGFSNKIDRLDEIVNNLDNGTSIISDLKTLLPDLRNDELSNLYGDIGYYYPTRLEQTEKVKMIIKVINDNLPAGKEKITENSKLHGKFKEDEEYAPYIGKINEIVTTYFVNAKDPVTADSLDNIFKNNSTVKEVLESCYESDNIVKARIEKYKKDIKDAIEKLDETKKQEAYKLVDYWKETYAKMELYYELLGLEQDFKAQKAAFNIHNENIAKISPNLSGKLPYLSNSEILSTFANDAAKALIDVSEVDFNSDNKLSLTLGDLKKFYSSDAGSMKQDAEAKLAAINKAISNIHSGKALDYENDEWAGIILALEANERGDFGAKGAEIKSYNDYKLAAEALKKIGEIKKNLEVLEEMKYKGFSALPEVKAKKAEINKRLASLGNIGDTADRLAHSLFKDDGTLVTVKEVFNSKNEDDKLMAKKIQSAANLVASTVAEGKKESTSNQALSSLNIQINNMNKRLGEIRGLNGEIGTWLRVYGGRYSSDNNHFNYYSTQIGADKLTSLGNGDLIIGALFGFDKVNADAKTKTASFGAYTSYIDNSGLFLDAVAKYAHSSHKQDSFDIKNQNLFLLSIEGGYRFSINDASYIEPSLELITGYVGKYEAKTSKASITVDSFTPLVFKPQVFFGYSIDDFTLRAGVGAVLNAKSPNYSVQIKEIIPNLDANSAKIRLDKNNYGFASIGGSYKFADNLRLNLGVERSFGGKLTQDYEVNAVLRYTF